MATHSSILAWRISWTEKPDRLQPIELQKVRHEQSDTHTHTHTCGGLWGAQHLPAGAGSRLSGADYTERSRSERKTPIQYTNAYIWNLERW